MALPNSFSGKGRTNKPGKSNRRGRLGTVDLLNKIACFSKKVNSVGNIKSG